MLGHCKKLTKCKFNLSNREEAMLKHKKGELIPANLDIALWTDGSLHRHGTLFSESEEPVAGAAAILQISDTDRHSTIFELEIHTKLKIANVTSSYETEIIALQ